MAGGMVMPVLHMAHCLVNALNLSDSELTSIIGGGGLISAWAWPQVCAWRQPVLQLARRLVRRLRLMVHGPHGHLLGTLTLA